MSNRELTLSLVPAACLYSLSLPVSEALFAFDSIPESPSLSNLYMKKAALSYQSDVCRAALLLWHSGLASKVPLEVGSEADRYGYAVWGKCPEGNSSEGAAFEDVPPFSWL